MQCGDCSSKRVLLDNILGEYYCQDCGLILEDMLVDFNDLSFAFGENGELKSYSITNFTDPERGLGTSFRHTVRRIAKKLKPNYLNRPEGFERNFHEAVPILRSAWNILDLPEDLKANSAILYRKALRKHITSGKRTESMVLAVIHNVCSEADFQKDLTEAAKAMKVPMQEIYNYSSLIKESTKKPAAKHYLKDYVKKGTDSLQLSDLVSIRINKLADKMVAKRFDIGKHPGVVAGVAIYAVCLENKLGISQSKIAKTLNVSPRSIRRVATELVRTT